MTWCSAPATGSGFEDNLAEAYRFLMDHYRDGDPGTTSSGSAAALIPLARSPRSSMRSGC
ncbi:MAG: DUF2235 domain-containing protein [Flavobacteriales bacterium]|nr:DUF2235 domain-containing protein [Flavobacteriales bacterium]